MLNHNNNHFKLRCGMANNTAVKTKMCWSCEGNVPLVSDDCPYCGVQLEGVKLYEQEEKKAAPEPHSEEVPDSPFGLYVHEGTRGIQEEEKPEEEDSNAEMLSVFDDMRKVLIPLLLLLGGSLFALFGAVLYLFAEDGVFTLRWSSEHWYLYLLVGVAALAFGGRALRALDDSIGE